MKHFIVSIRPGRPQIVEVVEMANRELELDDFYDTIDGFIEIIPTIIPGLKLVIDDCGKLKNYQLNILASELAQLFPFDQIVGPAMIAKQKGPELWPLDESDLSKLHEALFKYAQDWGAYVERH